MSDLLLPSGDGHTPLAPEDRRGLVPTYIATRGDLYDAEQRNIEKALRHDPPTATELLDDLYLRSLHRRMFDDVWEWAGQYRTREVSIGIDPGRVPVAVRQLVEDAGVWLERATYPPDELAIRFHHRLVETHPFPNGNGRHGRIAADYLIIGLGIARFTWGAGRPDPAEAVRSAYISALRAADRGDITGLLEFARS